MIILQCKKCLKKYPISFERCGRKLFCCNQQTVKVMDLSDKPKFSKVEKNKK